MSGDVVLYTALVTNEHADKPKFMAMVAASVQPPADLIALYQTISALYDVDLAVGEQLDVVGQWVGISRKLSAPLTGVYFALDTVGVGFDEGVWLGPYDPTTGLVSLPDDFYRLLIKAKILNNHWNGSKADAYTLIDLIFQSFGYQLFIEDPCDLTMRLGLWGLTIPPTIVIALLVSGELNIKPAGVHIAAYLYQSQPGPIFAFDLNNAMFGGFDTGGWATVVTN